MKAKRKPNNPFQLFKAALSIGLVLAVLAALMPQTAQAAQCQAYYTVREGDTTPYISHTFGFKWVDIATANDMKPWEKLTVGQVLCIPPADKSTKDKDTDTTTTTKSGKAVKQPEGESKAKIQVSVSASRIYISLSNFSDDHVYKAKVRDVDVGIGGWYKLGTIEIERKDTLNVSYNVPQDLRGVTHLNVCLKDQTSDELVCRTVLNK